MQDDPTPKQEESPEGQEGRSFSPPPAPRPPADSHTPAQAIPVARPIFDAPPPSPLLGPPGARADHPLHLRDLTRWDALLDLAMMAVALVAFEGLATVVVLLFMGADFDPDSASGMEMLRSALLPLVFGRAVVVLVAVGLIIKLRRLRLASVGAAGQRFFLNAAIGVVAAPVCAAVVFGVMMTLILLVPSAMEAQVENVDRLHRMVPDLTVLGALGLACAIGVYEELLFRGFIMPRIRRLTGGWFTAVLLTTVLFTWLHAADQMWTALVAISTLSVLFSVLTIVTRSIVPSIVAHMLWDFSVFVMLLTDLFGEVAPKDTVIAQIALLPGSLAVELVSRWPM